MNKKYCHTFLTWIIAAAFMFNIVNAQTIKNNRFINDKSLSDDLNGYTLKTDKTSYKQGEIITITGTGFGSFEEVQISVENDDELTGRNRTISRWNVFADIKGNISSEINFDSLVSTTAKNIIRADGTENKVSVETEFSGAVVAPIFVSGNPDCTDLNANNGTFPSITSNYGFKIDSNASGTFTLTNGPGLVLTGGAPSDPGNSVTTNVSGGTLLSWAATLGIDAVIVKGGPNANVYVYNPEAMSDTNLVTPNNGGFGVSHIEFCYDYEAKLRIIKDAVPNSPEDFKFSANNLPVAGFTLDDDAGAPGEDGVYSNFIDFMITGFGPSNKITVTEDTVPGWMLTNITCVEDSGGLPQIDNSTTSIGLRQASIIAEQGEMITCTFTNEVVLAASASIDGTITDSFGRGASKVLVRVTDLDNGETTFTITNPFGYYHIGDLQVGGNYIVRVSSKRYAFSPDSRIITLNEDVVGVDFTADPE
jgi:hypothetical protein